MGRNNSNGSMSGEQRLKQRRRDLIRFVAAGAVIAGISGFVSGWLTGDGTFIAAPWIAIPVCAVVLAAFVWFSIGYFRRIDELDLIDNLWASMIGIYFYIVALPMWYLLAKIEAAPPIDHWTIYSITLAVVVGAYIARRMGVRIPS